MLHCTVQVQLDTGAQRQLHLRGGDAGYGRSLLNEHASMVGQGLTVALLQVRPPSPEVLSSRSPPGAQPTPPSVGSWHAG